MYRYASTPPVDSRRRRCVCLHCLHAADVTRLPSAGSLPYTSAPLHRRNSGVQSLMSRLTSDFLKFREIMKLSSEIMEMIFLDSIKVHSCRYECFNISAFSSWVE